VLAVVAERVGRADGATLGELRVLGRRLHVTTAVGQRVYARSQSNARTPQSGLSRE
jgi:hypothetical protein